MRVSTKSLDNAREAFDALIATHKPGYRIDLDGNIRNDNGDNKMFAVHGRQGIAFLLACYIGSCYDVRGRRSEPRVTDRQLIDAALRALTDILVDATHGSFVDVEAPRGT